jgi:peptidoglycan/LPS O-acetylase OafA/YrhL
VTAVRAEVPSSAQMRRVLTTAMPGLDGIRGIAILLVMFAHFIGNYPAHSTIDFFVQRTLRAGWFGVDLFFALSGFLITGILIESREASNYFGVFYMRRLLRIFPLYYSFLLLWFVGVRFFVASRGWNIEAVGVDRQFSYWLYVANWLPLFGDGPGALGHLWSLAVEEQFYLVWPLVVWFVPGRRLGKLCIALIAAAPLLRWLMVAFHLPALAVYELTPARVDSLAFGALVSVALRDERWLGIAARVWRVVLALALVGLAVIVVYLRGLPNDPPVTQVLGYSLLACAASATVAGTVIRIATVSAVGILETKTLRIFGKYSYALYVLHHPIYSSLLGRLTVFRGGALLQSRSTYVLVMIFCFGLSFLLALLSWNVLEKPFLRLKHRFIPKSRNHSFVSTGLA